MKTLVVVISGIFTSALLYYINSALTLAQKQLTAANRLQAYLKHWHLYILDNGWFPIFNVGREWSEQEHTGIVAGKGPDELVKLREEKRAFVSKVFKEAQESGVVKLNRDGIRDYLRSLPKQAPELLITMGKTHVDNLVGGRTFITDEEAAVLGIGVVQEAVELKMNAIELITRSYAFAAAVLESPENFQDKDAEDVLGKLFWLAVLASRSSNTLFRFAQLFTTRSLAELTVRNIRAGSRLTKR